MSQPAPRRRALAVAPRPRRRSARGPLRASQRERLIEAIVELAGSLGSQSLSVAQISARAGVSSATFYEHFEDREQCLLAAYRELSELTVARMTSSLRGGDFVVAARPAFAQLLQMLSDDPEAGRVMFVEALAGGPRVRAQRERVLQGIVRTAEALLEGAPRDGITLDLPGRAVLGAVRHVISRHLRTNSEDKLPALADVMLAWMAGYAVPAAHGRWSVSPSAMLVGASAPPLAPARAERLPRGRHGLPPAAVARSQRRRILQATASVTMEKGYAATTVADIVAAAGVAKEAFYRHFGDKQQAFLEAQEEPGRQTLDSLVRAYFSADEWHERIWRALSALLEMIAANPVMAHLRLVECYTAGPEAVRRAEETTSSFTIFFEEGYRQRRHREELPRLFSEATAGAIFEVVQHEVAAGNTAALPRLLPQLSYVALAPFLGPEAAIAAIEEKIAAAGAAPGGTAMPAEAEPV